MSEPKKVGGGKSLVEIERQSKSILDRLNRQRENSIDGEERKRLERRIRQVEKTTTRYVSNIVNNNPQPFNDFAQQNTGWNVEETKKRTGVDVAESRKIPRSVYMKNNRR